MLLAREFASSLATPIYIADSDGTLVYFNESAETIGGQSVPEAGEMSIRQWAMLLRPRGVDGMPLERDAMPGGIAFNDRRPAHAQLLITGLDGVEREIATTAFPLFRQDGEFHGIMVIFWEQGRSRAEALLSSRARRPRPGRTTRRRGSRCRSERDQS